MTAHKHAALRLQYTQDWVETDKPWKRWQYLHNGEWKPVLGHHRSGCAQRHGSH